MRFPTFQLRLPDWVDSFLPDSNHVYATVEERMQLVIELARLNIQHGTGGPFGAGIFDRQTHKLLAPGINLVVPSHCSVAHAEMVAFMIAQQMVGTFDLGSQGLPEYELVASTEPCAMCFGATPWSGVTALVCGARDEDARRIGFDEGPKLDDWASALLQRGIEVTRDVCRPEAIALLQNYAASGALIYNARQAMDKERN